PPPNIFVNSPGPSPNGDDSGSSGLDSGLGAGGAGGLIGADPLPLGPNSRVNSPELFSMSPAVAGDFGWRRGAGGGESSNSPPPGAGRAGSADEALPPNRRVNSPEPSLDPP